MSKVISGDSIVESEPWAPPVVDKASKGKVPDRPYGNKLLTARQIEEVQQQAYEESYDKGYKEGLAAGKLEINKTVQHLNTVVNALAKPFEELDDKVEEELVILVIAIAKQLIRRELKTDPGQVIGVVRECTSSLPVASQNIRLFLHPDDAAIIRDELVPAEGEPAWKIMEEPTMARGGCRVVTDTSRVDATVETRLNSIITRFMGGERQADDE